MHEQLHTSDPDLQRLMKKFYHLMPEHQDLFIAYLEALSKSPDILPPFPGTPERGQ